MLSKLLTGVAVSGLALAAQTALAGGGYDYARVLDVDPIVTRSRVSVPTQQCWNESRYEPGDFRATGSGRAGATLVGGLLGAVVGNQFGHGEGRRAATVAGAVLGATVGNQAAANRGDRDHYAYEEPRRYQVERCATRYEERFEQRIEGYRVSYVYQGHRYTAQMPYDPGDRIRIRVNVHPADF